MNEQYASSLANAAVKLTLSDLDNMVARALTESGDRLEKANIDGDNVAREFYRGKMAAFREIERKLLEIRVRHV